MLFNENKDWIGSIDFSAACDFIDKHHEHNKRTVGHIFSLGLWRGRVLIGVAVCGRPVSRHLDDGKTIEVYRNCVPHCFKNTKNACSILYGACIRTAKKKGFTKVITYTLMSEKGSSLKAANFIMEAENVGGIKWTGKRKFVDDSGELKRRWAIKIKPLKMRPA